MIVTQEYQNYVEQEYHSYLEEDHRTWSILSESRGKLNFCKAATEYQQGLRQLALDGQRIADIKALSRRLESISGWTLYPVDGLIPTKDFFYMLIKKKYPITVSVRRPDELNFSELPDIFHDIYGHVPLLTSQKFYRFLTEFSTIALRYADDEKAVECLGRLYWFTFEMGLIREGDRVKPYGGAIITSASEISNVEDEQVPKYAFDIDHIFRTPYNSFKLQREYFIIESFDQLFNSIASLESHLQYHLAVKHNRAVTRMPLNPNITEGFNNVIGFLNDTQFKFPQATSFVAGQPDEKFFNLEAHLAKFNTYIDHLSKDSTLDRSDLINRVGQYNKTKGIVNEIVAEHLRKDEQIDVAPGDILITVGAQEAFAAVVSTVCNRETDVILLEDPSYIGVSSFAKVYGFQLGAVTSGDEGIDLDDLEAKIAGVQARGLNVKLVYVIPDFQNPTGSRMPLEKRLQLLKLAEQYNFLIIEDSVYNSFTYSQKKTPTLKSLDQRKRVIYVGSFSKSLFPGLRIGLLVADQQIEYAPGRSLFLSDELAKVKAVLTNNTPTINQAVLAGILLSSEYSLEGLNQPKFEHYKLKRDRMIDALDRYIRQVPEAWARQVQWNEPDGGFFLKVKVPFEADTMEVINCAENFNVIFCPMYFFYLNGGGTREIRLTFSNLSLAQIDEGVRNFARYLKSKITRPAHYAGVQSLAD